MSTLVKIIPQSVCSRYGLAIGAAVAPFVRVLVCVCFPVAFPISKVTIFAELLFYLSKHAANLICSVLISLS